MEIHPRYFLVQKAKLEIEKAFFDLEVKHRLTAIECLQVLTGIQANYLKYMLRAERHPTDPEAKGDEAPAEAEIQPLCPGSGRMQHYGACQTCGSIPTEELTDMYMPDHEDPRKTT